jgi:hypothetical protein
MPGRRLVGNISFSLAIILQLASSHQLIGDVGLTTGSWVQQLLKAGRKHEQNSNQNHAQLSPTADRKVDKISSTHNSYSSLEAATRAAERSSIAALDAASAAAVAVNLHQRAATWLHHSKAASAFADAVADDSQEALAASRALEAARAAASEYHRAVVLAEQATHSHEVSSLHNQTSSQESRNGDHPALTTTLSQDDAMYESEKTTAQLVGLCVLIICILICWIQASAITRDDFRRWREPDETVGIFDQPQRKWMCCCCRASLRCGKCIFRTCRLCCRCSGATLLILLVVTTIAGFGAKLAWDRHLIQPRLEELTMQLFLLTLAFAIVLIILGEFMFWMKRKISVVHDVVAFVDDKVDDIMDTFGLDRRREMGSGISPNQDDFMKDIERPLSKMEHRPSRGQAVGFLPRLFKGWASSSSSDRRQQNSERPIPEF